jgi:hypothetical protein
MAAKFKFEPCPTCCEEDLCTHCTGAIPAQMQLVISGIVAKSPVVCGDCDGLNGTFVLDRETGTTWGSPDGGKCLWSYYPPSPICTYDMLHVDLYGTGSNTFIEVYWRDRIPGSTEVIRWFKTYVGSAKIGCDSFSAVALTFNLGGTKCNGSSSSCLLTSL